MVFPETWLPGYPAWLDCCRDYAVWDHAPTKKLFARLMANSVEIPGPVTESWPLLRASITVVLNISAHERVSGRAGSRHAL